MLRSLGSDVVRDADMRGGPDPARRVGTSKLGVAAKVGLGNQSGRPMPMCGRIPGESNLGPAMDNSIVHLL